jgi:phage tail-like protein
MGLITVSLDGRMLRELPVTRSLLRIGRLPENDIELSHPDVSREHAELRVEAGGVTLVDLGSRLGTLVGDRPLRPQQPVQLEPGVQVHIGPYLLTYVTPGASFGAAPGTKEEREEDAPSPPAPEAPSPGEEATEVLPPELAPRPTWPPTLPEAATSAYLHELPSVFHDSRFLGRLLLIFEALWEPLERRQDQIAMYFDPRTCPPSMLSFLAGWFGLRLDPYWPEPRQRELVSEAMDLYRFRGTHYGLTRMIEVCTGLQPLVTADESRPFTIRIAVTIPPGSRVRREAVEELVRAHKPAHVGYVLQVQS